MANDIVKWRDGGITRAVGLEKMMNLFEEYGAQGLTSAEIGHRMGSTGVASRVMSKFPMLKEAYQRGIDGRTIDGEAMLVKRVMGFKEKVTSKVTRTVSGNVVEVIEKEEDMYFPPDVSAIRVFLKGRENSRYSGDEDGKSSVIINLDRTDSAL